MSLRPILLMCIFFSQISRIVEGLQYEHIFDGLGEIDFQNIGGFANATTSLKQRDPTQAFIGGYWVSDSNILPQAIWYQFLEKRNVVGWSFKGTKDRGPTMYDFFGSNGPSCSDRLTWDFLATDASGIPFSNTELSTPEDKPKAYRHEHLGLYKCYGFNIDVVGTLGERVSMNSIRFYDRMPSNEVDYIDQGTNKRGLQNLNIMPAVTKTVDIFKPYVGAPDSLQNYVEPTISNDVDWYNFQEVTTKPVIVTREGTFKGQTNKSISALLLTGVTKADPPANSSTIQQNLTSLEFIDLATLLKTNSSGEYHEGLSIFPVTNSKIVNNTQSRQYDTLKKNLSNLDIETSIKDPAGAVDVVRTQEFNTLTEPLPNAVEEVSMTYPFKEIDLIAPSTVRPGNPVQHLEDSLYDWQIVMKPTTSPGRPLDKESSSSEEELVSDVESSSSEEETGTARHGVLDEMMPKQEENQSTTNNQLGPQLCKKRLSILTEESEDIGDDLQLGIFAVLAKFVEFKECTDYQCRIQYKALQNSMEQVLNVFVEGFEIWEESSKFADRYGSILNLAIPVMIPAFSEFYENEKIIDNNLEGIGLYNRTTDKYYDLKDLEIPKIGSEDFVKMRDQIYEIYQDAIANFLNFRKPIYELATLFNNVSEELCNYLITQ